MTATQFNTASAPDIIPDIIPYITLDNLLSGYNPSPIVQRECAFPKDDKDFLGDLVEGIMAQITQQIPPQYHEKFNGYPSQLMINECVENLMRHCCEESHLAFYLSLDRKRLIGMFELNEDTQFGRKGYQDYIDLLKDEVPLLKEKDAFCEGIWDNPCRTYHLGTFFILQNNLTRAGVVDNKGIAYSFFEYPLE